MSAWRSSPRVAHRLSVGASSMRGMSSRRRGPRRMPMRGPKIGRLDRGRLGLGPVGHRHGGELARLDAALTDGAAARLGQLDARGARCQLQQERERVVGIDRLVGGQAGDARQLVGPEDVGGDGDVVQALALGLRGCPPARAGRRSRLRWCGRPTRGGGGSPRGATPAACPGRRSGRTGAARRPYSSWSPLRSAIAIRSARRAIGPSPAALM